MKRVWFKVVEDFGLKFGLDAMRCRRQLSTTTTTTTTTTRTGENVGNRKHGGCADETPNHRTSSVGDGAKHGE
jgi:hypothetical protein